MNLAIVVAAFGIAAGGMLLIVRGLVGVTTPLSDVVAELHRPRNVQPIADWKASTVRALVGRRSDSLVSDLTACDRDDAKYVQDRVVWSVLGAAPGVVLLLVGSAGVVWSSPAIGLATATGGAVTGWFYARLDLASDAAKARREFRHALAAYLELVTILMSGGAGVETAMFDAVASGRGSAFRHLRSSLTAAQARREPPWRMLGALGQRLGVSELEELEASMTLAGGGAQVRDSLAAKAAGMRLKDLAQLESEEHSRSETMVLPVALMFAGFLVLLGYPALSALERL